MARPIIAFILDRVKGTDEARIRMRVKWDGCRCVVAMNVGYRVNVYRWDSESQRCIPRSFHGARRTPASVINAEIDRFEEKAREALQACSPEPSPAEYRKALAEALDGAPEKLGVFQAFAQFVSERGERNRWTDATYTQMMSMRRHLMDFNPQLSWEDFDEDGLYRYIAYLRTRVKVKRKKLDRENGAGDYAGLCDSTTEKQIGYLKWFLKWADSKGLMTCRDYIAFRPKLQTAEKPVIFLEWGELMTVYNYQFTEEQKSLERVRDVFCFCAFTSLRYSDVHALRWSDVGDTSIRVVTQKTTDALVIELNKYSQELLSRYADEAYPDDKVFPVISNQKMNAYLKELMRLCRLDKLIRVTSFRDGRRVDKLVPKWQLIGTHAARRTFICNALMMGIAPNVVMRWTGHADYDSMKPYIAIADSAKAAAMAKFDEL